MAAGMSLTFGYICMTLVLLLFVWFLVRTFLQSYHAACYNRWFGEHGMLTAGAALRRLNMRRRRSTWVGDAGAQWDDEYLDFVDVSPELGYESDRGYQAPTLSTGQLVQ